MANRAILLNTPFLTSDPWLLEGKLKEPGTDFMEVAEAAYKIPVPWLLCFRSEDIRPVNVPLETDADAPARAIEVGLPCTSVRQALKNMEQALPIFTAIAGNSKIGKLFWQNAMTYLQAMPLRYLALNPIEVMFMADHAPYEQLMRTAMSGDSAAIEALVELSCYQKGVQPFPPDVLYAVAGGDRRDPRNENCVALDIGYGSFWHDAADSEGKERPDLPLPVASPAVAPNLRTLSDEVEALAKSLTKSAKVNLSFAPKTKTQGEQLKMLLSADTDAECGTLLNDKPLRTKLEGPIHTALASVCRDYGFSWVGYVVRSDESVKRRFTGDYKIYNDWISMPVVK